MIFPSRRIGRRRKRMKVTFSAEESGCNTYIIQPDWHSCTVNQTWSAKNKLKTDLLLPSLTFFQYFQFNETIRLSTCCKKKTLSNAKYIEFIYNVSVHHSNSKLQNSQRKDRDACNYSHNYLKSFHFSSMILFPWHSFCYEQIVIPCHR